MSRQRWDSEEQVLVDDDRALLRTIHDALFGRWDRERNVKVPGIVDQIREIKSGQRVAYIIGGCTAAVVVAHALGVPTEDAAKIIHSLVAAF